MIIGYARTSTLEQEAGFTAQVRDLKAAGVEKIVKEQVSAVSERPRLEAALHSLRKGDQLVVCKLDRLARSVVCPSSRSLRHRCCSRSGVSKTVKAALEAGAFEAIAQHVAEMSLIIPRG